jgi:hypothetical protein
MIDGKGLIPLRRRQRLTLSEKLLGRPHIMAEQTVENIQGLRSCING